MTTYEWLIELDNGIETGFSEVKEGQNIFEVAYADISKEGFMQDIKLTDIFMRKVN